MKKNSIIKIIQNKEKPIAAEVIAESILEISNGVKKMNLTRLTRRAIVALIHENSKVARSTIEVVLNNLDSLEITWLKK